MGHYCDDDQCVDGREERLLVGQAGGLQCTTEDLHLQTTHCCPLALLHEQAAGTVASYPREGWLGGRCSVALLALKDLQAHPTAEY